MDAPFSSGEITMKKELNQDVHTLYHFYRPHKRVLYEPKLCDPATGEWTTPQRRVKQSHVDECDINNILKQYSVTGQIKHISAKAAMGQYLDLPGEMDFQISLNIIKDAEQAFGSLPSKVRDRFGNDAAQFLAFMADANNIDEAIKLGLATRAPLKEPVADSNGAKMPPQKPPQAPTAAPAAPKAPEGS